MKNSKPLKIVKKRSAILLILITVFSTALGRLYASPQNQYADNSVLGSGYWWKIDVTHEGIYRINPGVTRELLGSYCDNIAIYGTEGGALGLKNNSSYHELEEIAIVVKDFNGNGIMDSEDYILFYGEGPDTWRYDNGRNIMVHSNHPYATSNSYYLTLSGTHGRRVEAAQTPAATTASVSSFTTTYLIERDDLNINKTGQLWVDNRLFSPTVTTRSYSLDCSNIGNIENVTLYCALASISTASSSFKVSIGNTTATLSYYQDSKYKNGFATTQSGDMRNCTIQYQPLESGATGYLDYLQFGILADIRFSGNQIIFHNLECHGTNSAAEMQITSSIDNPVVWDITDRHHIRQTAQGTRWAAYTDSIRSFVVFTPEHAYTPHSISALSNQNLHGEENPEMVIVTHPLLQEQAERLADLHRISEGMIVLVATDEAVYNEYSSGKQDPMALKHMMRSYWKRWEQDQTLTKPKYLLLLGHGSYDNKNLTQINKTSIVTYESPESLGDNGASFCSDDMMAYLQDNEQGNSGETMDIAVGRLPASTKAQATHLIDKIEQYILNEDLTIENERGDWRNYATLLSDDNDDPTAGDGGFAPSAEDLAQHIKANYPNLNIDRIYADAYTQQSSAIGSFYPDVNNALTKRINSGTLLLNYIGHGSERYIGTERYMEFSDIESYSNIHKQTFFITSTCSFGHFDNPAQVSGAEAFLLAEGGGIGVVSAARPITHRKEFNTALCVNTLNPKYTVGEAFQIAKNAYSASHSINLFADPALRLSIPKNKIDVTHINGIPIDSNRTDTAIVLSTVTVEGVITDSLGNPISDFNGKLYPIVFDREMAARTLANDHAGTEFDFVQQKSILYKGVTSVTNGRFSYTFTVPRDVAYHFDYGRISHFAKSENGDIAAGYYSNIVFGGFNSQADLSEHHPIIELYMGDTTFLNGGYTDENPLLFAVLKDTIGINYFGSGLGHDITAIIDGNSNNTILLNDFYEPNPTDPTIGYIQYRLGSLEEGVHTLIMKAWNIYNYSGSDTITFQVKRGSTNCIGTLETTPNPTQGIVNLSLSYNGSKDVKHIKVELYNSRGMKIYESQYTPETDSYTIKPPSIDISSQPRGLYIARILLEDASGSRMEATSKIIKY